MEVQEEMIRITVVIAGRPYPLKINPKDEPIVRQIVNQVNARVNQFQQTYKKDKQDLLAMTLLTYAMELHKTSIKSASELSTPTDTLSNDIQELDDLVEDLLEKSISR